MNGKSIFRLYAIGSLTGFVIGFLLLHPFSMLFQGLVTPYFDFNLSVIRYAFSMTHMAMAFFFGLLGLGTGCLVAFFLTTLSQEKEKVKMLEGLLPICCYCKKIKEEPGREGQEDKWVKIEEYIQERSDADFTHGVCPDCFGRMMDEIEKK